MPARTPTRKRQPEICQANSALPYLRPGATAIVFGLPLLLNFLFLTCNDQTGCPAPALLSPRTLSWDKLKAQVPWPEEGLAGFANWETSAWVAAYYLLSLILYRVLPAQEVYGTKLRESGRPLKYRFNGRHPSRDPGMGVGVSYSD